MIIQNPPLQTSVDIGQKLSTTWHQWFSGLHLFLRGVPYYTDVFFGEPADGFNTDIPDDTKVVTLDPAAPLATGSMTMPPNPYDGQHMNIMSTENIASFLLMAGAGSSIKNAPTSLSAGVGVEYYYRAANATWYRV
jgi:hypothetical protein